MRGYTGPSRRVCICWRGPRSLSARGAGLLVTDAKAFDRLAGTDRLRTSLARGAQAGDIIAMWRAEVARIRESGGRATSPIERSLN